MSLRRLIKDLSFYGIIDAVQRFLGFLFIPYYALKLTQNEYGEYDLFVVISSTLYVIVDLQLISGFNRFYNEYKSRKEKSELIGSILIIRFVAWIIVTITVLSLLHFGSLDSAYWPSYQSNGTEWLLIVFYPIATSLFDSMIALSRMSRRKKSFGLITFLTLLITYASAVFLLESTNLKVIGLLCSLFFGKLSGGIVGLFIMRDSVSIKLNYSIVKELIKYCVPLIPGWWISFASLYISRFLVYGEIGAQYNALLSILMKSLLLVNIVTLSFKTAWYPLAMAVHAKKDSKEFYVSSNRLFLISLSVVLIIGTLAVDFTVNNFLPSNYAEVTVYFPIFLLSTVVAAAEDNFQLGLTLSKKTTLISIGAFIYSIASAAILLIFIDDYGLFAVGFSLLIPSIMRLVFTYIASQKYFYIPYSRSTIILFMVLVFLMSVYQYSIINELGSLVFLKILLSSFGVIYLLVVVKGSDVKRILELIRERA